MTNTDDQQQSSNAHRKHRKRRIVLLSTALLVVLLVALRAMLPIWIERYAERVLSSSEDYTASIHDVDLNLWRGAYQIEGLLIEKTNGEVASPLLDAPLTDLSLQWSALFAGAVVAEITMSQPQLSLVAGPSEDTTQTGESDWISAVRELAPVRINRFEVKEGTLLLLNPHSSPKVEQSIREIQLLVTNLSNVEDDGEEFPSQADLSADAFNGGDLTATLNLQPLASPPRFDLDLRLQEVELVELNDFLGAYARTSAESGTFGLSLEALSSEDGYSGYVKPVVTEIELLDLDEDLKEGPLSALWDATLELVAEIFENQKEDQIAARVPFQASLDGESEVSLLTTLGSLLRNAFIQALATGLDYSIGRVPGTGAGNGS